MLCDRLSLLWTQLLGYKRRAMLDGHILVYELPEEILGSLIQVLNPCHVQRQLTWMGQLLCAFPLKLLDPYANEPAFQSK
jgi:hypothetical protein